MKETVLLYKMENTNKKAELIQLMNTLNIGVIIIEDKDLNQQMGYLLHLDGYQKQNDSNESLKEEMMILFNFDDNKMNILLQILRNSEIPFIPLKAAITPTNVDWTFKYLHEHVKEEHEMMTKQ